MVPEISVYLPNVPGQFGRVLKALDEENLNISGFSVDLAGAVSLLRLLFSDADEARRATLALTEYDYETARRQLLLLSRPDKPGELRRVAETLGDNGINVEYGYVALGTTAEGHVFFAIKVDDGKVKLAKEVLQAAGIEDHDRVPTNNPREE